MFGAKLMLIQLINSTSNYCARSVPATRLFAQHAVHNMTLCHQRGYSLKEDIKNTNESNKL